MEEHRFGIQFAIVAGSFATGGSLLGKLAGGVDASSLVSVAVNLNLRDRR